MNAKLTIWPDLSTRTDKIGEKYLDTWRNIPILANAFSKYKYPAISTDEMESSDIDTFISAIKELGTALDVEMNE